jgi:ketosteroid isomerase-like protein
MSEENVEIVRRAYEHLSATHLPLPEVMDAEIEFSLAWMEGRGVDAFRDAITEWVGTFDEWTIEATNLTAAGPNQVIAIVRDKGRPKDSGAAIDNEFAHLWTLRDGRAIRFEAFTERAQALEAAGLSE